MKQQVIVNGVLHIVVTFEDENNPFNNSVYEVDSHLHPLSEVCCHRNNIGFVIDPTTGKYLMFNVNQVRDARR